MISDLTPETINWITIITSAPGGCALAIVFWMLLKELPAQRQARDKMVDDFSRSLSDMIKSFREELAIERQTTVNERQLDRLSRHEDNTVQSSTVTALTQALSFVQEHRRNP